MAEKKKEKEQNGQTHARRFGRLIAICPPSNHPHWRGQDGTISPSPKNPPLARARWHSARARWHSLALAQIPPRRGPEMAPSGEDRSSGGSARAHMSSYVPSPMPRLRGPRGLQIELLSLSAQWLERHTAPKNMLVSRMGRSLSPDAMHPCECEGMRALSRTHAIHVDGDIGTKKNLDGPLFHEMH